ncbi:hypothetical protein M514_24309 [Trichuris suis]|uniref:Uncharacterized protein n=1 Tax=Trichuris suis TaxID=68888 RepID=A0A085N204_9BILA|nr:hypothetical protein M514_24309 [Trichuris suis]
MPWLCPRKKSKVVYEVALITPTEAGKSIGAVVKVSPLDTFVFRRYQEYVTHRPVDEGQESCIPPPLKKEFDLLMLSHDCNFDRSVRQSSWEL